MDDPRQLTVKAAPGIDLRAYDWGGEGPTLIISHATGFHARCYSVMVENLTDHFHCFGIDHRGSGDSDLEISPQLVEGGVYRGTGNLLEARADLPTLQGYAEDILGLVAHLGHPEVFLFGHSAGGMAALTACERLASKVKGVYVFEPPLSIWSPSSPGSVFFMFHDHVPGEPTLTERTVKRRHQFASKREALDSLQKRGFKAFHPRVLQDYVEHGLKAAPGGAGVVLKMDKEVEAILYHEIQFQTAQEYHAILQVRAPLWLGYGDRGRVNHSRLDFLPNAQCVKFTKAGHFFPFTDPERMASGIRKAFCGNAKL